MPSSCLLTRLRAPQRPQRPLGKTACPDVRQRKRLCRRRDSGRFLRATVGGRGSERLAAVALPLLSSSALSQPLQAFSRGCASSRRTCVCSASTQEPPHLTSLRAPGRAASAGRVAGAPKCSANSRPTGKRLSRTVAMIWASRGGRGFWAGAAAEHPAAVDGERGRCPGLLCWQGGGQVQASSSAHQSFGVVNPTQLGGGALAHTRKGQCGFTPSTGESKAEALRPPRGRRRRRRA
jgi:hypothetical protein